MKHRASSTHRMWTPLTDTTTNRQTNGRVSSPVCLFVFLCLIWSLIQTVQSRNDQRYHTRLSSSLIPATIRCQ